MPHSTIEAAVMVVMGLLVGAFAAGYSAVQYWSRRRAGMTTVVITWLALSATLGFIQVRRTCSMGLTCDVGGVDYFALYFPSYAGIVATSLGAVTLLVARWHRQRASLTPRRLVLAGVAGVVGLVIALASIKAANRFTCDRRVARAPTGEWITECEATRRALTP